MTTFISYLENTLYYTGETDRADVEGSQKATEEFVPLLNFYYNRWKASPASPKQPPAVVPTGLRLFNYFQTRLVEGDTITYRKHLFILFTHTWLPALLTFGVATATIYYFFQSTIGACDLLESAGHPVHRWAAGVDPGIVVAVQLHRLAQRYLPGHG